MPRGVRDPQGRSPRTRSGLGAFQGGAHCSIDWFSPQAAEVRAGQRVQVVLALLQLLVLLHVTELHIGRRGLQSRCVER